MYVSRSQRSPFTAAAYMRESARFVCDDWCDTFQMFTLILDYTLTVVSILTRFSLSFYTTLLLKLLVVKQEIVLSAAVGRLLLDWLGLTPTCEFPRNQPLFDFGDSRFSVISVIKKIFHSRIPPQQHPEIPCKNKHKQQCTSTLSQPQLTTLRRMRQSLINAVTYYLTHDYDHIGVPAWS